MNKTIKNYATDEFESINVNSSQHRDERKRRIKIGAGWHGNYGPQLSLNVDAILAVADFLRKQNVTDGYIKLRILEYKKKYTNSSPDFVLVTSNIIGLSSQEGYSELEFIDAQE